MAVLSYHTYLNGAVSGLPKFISTLLIMGTSLSAE
jgi:hypothetical protein